MNRLSSRIRPHPLAAGAAAALLALAGAPSVHAFEQGTSAFSVGVGTGSQFSKDYTVLSARAGLYFVREFEASVGLQFWRGANPSITRLAPELRYVYTRMFRLKPYGSVFFSRSLYGNGISARNTYGFKGGALWTLNPNAHLALGGVHERTENCDPNTYGHCSETYPEVGLHFTF